MTEIAQVAPQEVASGEPISLHIDDVEALLSKARFEGGEGINGIVLFDSLRGDDIRLADGAIVDSLGNMALLLNSGLERAAGNRSDNVARRQHDVDQNSGKFLTYYQFHDGLVAAVEVDLRVPERETSIVAPPHIPDRVMIRAGYNLDGIDFDRVA